MRLHNSSIFLCFSLLITILFVVLRIFYPPQPSDIFVIGEPSLTYGETTLTGIIRPADKGYVLDLGNNTIINVVNAPNLDDQLNLQVSISGYLMQDEYANNNLYPYEMQVLNPWKRK